MSSAHSPLDVDGFLSLTETNEDGRAATGAQRLAPGAAAALAHTPAPSSHRYPAPAEGTDLADRRGVYNRGWLRWRPSYYCSTAAGFRLLPL